MKLLKKEILLALVTLGSMASMAVGTVAHAQQLDIQIIQGSSDGSPPPSVDAAPADVDALCAKFWGTIPHPENAQWLSIPFNLYGVPDGEDVSFYHGAANGDRPHDAVCPDGYVGPEPCNPGNQVINSLGDPTPFELWVYWPGGPGPNAFTEDTFWIALKDGTVIKATYELKWPSKNKRQCILTDTGRLTF